MLIEACPELMTELVPTSDSVRRRLPRWDPRLWGGDELVHLAKTRSGAELRRLGLTWGRARAQAASSSRPSADSARNDATPPCRAQQAPAVDHRASPALASTALGGVGGPQAAVTAVSVITPQIDAAEDRRRWASPAYLTANGLRLARLHYEPSAKGEPRLETPSSLHASNLHVMLNLPDHLGSSSLIIDHATSELVEARTYQPYGATESDYRPERWKGFREDYGFTGKEEDVEVGLQYFGKRYSSPYLGRWLSADPLAVHVPGRADLNLYAYVRGKVLKAIDPVGLEDADWSAVEREAPKNTGSFGTPTTATGLNATLGKVPIQGGASTGSVTPSQAQTGPAPTGPSATYVDTGRPPAPSHASFPTSAGGGDSRPGSRAGEEVLGLMGTVAVGTGMGAAAGYAGGAAIGFLCGASVVCGAAVGAVALGAGAYSLWTEREELASNPHSAALAISGIAGGGLTAQAGLQGGSYGRALVQSRFTNPSGSTLNCTLCAQATDVNLSSPLRLQTAKPLESPGTVMDVEGYTGVPFEMVPGGPSDARAAIEGVLISKGWGSRGIVFGDRSPDVGHVWNAQNMWGKVRFVDGQSAGPATFEGGYSGFGFSGPF